MLPIEMKNCTLLEWGLGFLSLWFDRRKIIYFCTWRLFIRRTSSNMEEMLSMLDSRHVWYACAVQQRRTFTTGNPIGKLLSQTLAFRRKLSFFASRGDCRQLQPQPFIIGDNYSALFHWRHWVLSWSFLISRYQLHD